MVQEVFYMEMFIFSWENVICGQWGQNIYFCGKDYIL